MRGDRRPERAGPEGEHAEQRAQLDEGRQPDGVAHVQQGEQDRAHRHRGDRPVASPEDRHQVAAEGDLLAQRSERTQGDDEQRELEPAGAGEQVRRIGEAGREDLGGRRPAEGLERSGD